MTKGLKRLQLTGSFVAMAVAISGVARAQEAGSSEGQAAEQSDVIIVTAQKRQQDINDVGLSISAFSGDTLAARGIDGIEDFGRIESSFTANQSLSGTPTYTIRGVGYNDFALTAPPAVTVYVDEVPLIYSPMTRGADLDIERVEVLKGPQGTLFGQNSTGGAINFIAARPTAQLSYGLTGRYERFGRASLTGHVSGPLSDTVGVRLSFDSDAGGAWQQSYTRDDELGNAEFFNLRLLTEWQPTDRLTVLLNLNGWRDRSDTQAGQQLGVLNRQAVLDTFPFFVDYPSAPEDNKYADWDPTVSHENREDFIQAGLRIDYDLSEALTLTSISSYSEYDRDSDYDVGGFSIYNNLGNYFGYVNAFSQELRIGGSSLDDRLAWVVGVNYLWSKADDNQINDVSHGAGSFAFVPAGGEQFLTIRNNSQTRTESFAFFANGEFAVTDALSLVFGARYTDSSTDFAGCTYDTGDGTYAAGINLFQNAVVLQPGDCGTLITPPPLVPGVVTDKLDEDSIAFRAGVNFEVTDDILLYGNVSRGYKSGAFPTQGFIFSPSTAPVVQERVMAYEAGFKASLLNRRIQLNGAYFHYDYRNKQVNGAIQDPIFGTLFGLINIPESKIDGFELSVMANPVEGLSLNGSVTYLDSKVTESFVNINRNGDFVDFLGESFPFTSDWSYNIGAEYEVPLSNAFDAYFGANYSYRSGTTNAFGRVDEEFINGYGLLDARVGFRTADDRWLIELYGQNLTDEYYWMDATLLQDAFFRRTGRPLTYGIRFGVKY